MSVGVMFNVSLMGTEYRVCILERQHVSHLGVCIRITWGPFKKM